MKIEQIKISELSPYSRNAKKHDDKQIERISQSIKEFGFMQPVVVDKGNIIIVGHARTKAAKLAGLDTVPVVRATNLSNAQIRAYRIADNKLAEMGWEKALLTDELSELESLEVDMDMLGFDDEDMQKLYDVTVGNEDKDVCMECGQVIKRKK